MPERKLDAIDRRILRELQQDGSLRNDLLADRIILSPAPTLRRVRALEESGVIHRYVALVNPQRLGLDVRVKVDVRFISQTRVVIDAFAEAVAAMPEVVECSIVAGEWDAQLTVVARDVEDYQRFVLNGLATLSCVAAYRSTLIVREIKRTTALPV
jgi:Lrp/AsnC family transcriptional regulator, leucine-responsive regulatory protein